MSEFTARENIRRFKSQILDSTDEVQKTMLHRLLSDEQILLHELLAERGSASGPV
jgi:hypothetical protein